MRSFALLLLLINIVFLLWQLTLLPWIPWQPTHFVKIDLEAPAHSKLPSLVMVSEPINDQKFDNHSFSTDHKVTPPEKHENPKHPLKVAEIVEPVQEVKEILPEETQVDMKKNFQGELASSNPHQILKQEEPPILKMSESVLNKGIPPEEKKLEKEMPIKKEEIAIKKEISLQNNKKIESKVTCFQMGPYSTTIEADKAVQWLRQQKITAIEVQNRKTQMITGTWVYLPPFSNQAATVKASSRLTLLGIKDYRIITSGELNNAISLGVFRQEENVNNLLKTLKNAGYSNPQTEKRYKNETTYWLSVKMPHELTSLLKNVDKKSMRPSPIPVNCQ